MRKPSKAYPDFKDGLLLFNVENKPFKYKIKYMDVLVMVFCFDSDVTVKLNYRTEEKDRGFFLSYRIMCSSAMLILLTFVLIDGIRSKTIQSLLLIRF